MRDARGRRWKSFRRALSGSQHEWLIEMLDWPRLPRRSFLVVAILVLTPPLFLCAVVIAALEGPRFLVSVGYISEDALRSLAYDDGRALLPLGLLALAAALALAIFLGNVCAIAARRELAKFPERALFSGKMPSLYLRQFANENPELEQRSRDSILPTWMDGEGNVIPKLFVGSIAMLRIVFGKARDHSFENLLHKSAAKIGPLICLSDPLQRRRTGEAARIPILNERWQDAVSGLSSACHLVILTFTESANLDWEAEQVLSRHDGPTLIHVPHLQLLYYAEARASRASEMTLLANEIQVPPKWLSSLMTTSNIRTDQTGKYGVMFMKLATGGVRSERFRPDWSDTSRAFDAVIASQNPTRSPHRKKVGIAHLQAASLLSKVGMPSAFGLGAVALLPQLMAVYGFWSPIIMIGVLLAAAI